MTSIDSILKNNPRLKKVFGKLIAFIIIAILCLVAILSFICCNSQKESNSYRIVAENLYDRKIVEPWGIEEYYLQATTEFISSKLGKLELEHLSYSELKNLADDIYNQYPKEKRREDFIAWLEKKLESRITPEEMDHYLRIDTCEQYAQVSHKIVIAEQFNYYGNANKQLLDSILHGYKQDFQYIANCSDSYRAFFDSIWIEGDEERRIKESLYKNYFQFSSHLSSEVVSNEDKIKDTFCMTMKELKIESYLKNGIKEEHLILYLEWLRNPAFHKILELIYEYDQSKYEAIIAPYTEWLKSVELPIN